MILWIGDEPGSMAGMPIDAMDSALSQHRWATSGATGEQINSDLHKPQSSEESMTQAECANN